MLETIPKADANAYYLFGNKHEKIIVELNFNSHLFMAKRRKSQFLTLSFFFITSCLRVTLSVPIFFQVARNSSFQLS